MNKFKKVLSLSVLSMAALSMATGACFLIQPTSISKSSADVVEETITNVIPSYINKGEMTQNNTYFSKDLPLSFTTEIKTGRGTIDNTTTAKQVHAYFPNKTEDPNHYYLFNDIQISVYLNGKQIPVDSSNYILTSNDYIRNGDAAIYPQTLQMEIARDTTLGETTATESAITDTNGEITGWKVTPGKLSIDKSGLLEVNISYGLYDTTFVPGKIITLTTTISPKPQLIQIKLSHTPLSFSTMMIILNLLAKTLQRLKFHHFLEVQVCHHQHINGNTSTITELKTCQASHTTQITSDLHLLKTLTTILKAQLLLSTQKQTKL